MIRALVLFLTVATGAVASPAASAAPDPVAPARRAFDDGEFEKALKLAERALKKKLPPEQASPLHLLRGQALAIL